MAELHSAEHLIQEFVTMSLSGQQQHDLGDSALSDTEASSPMRSTALRPRTSAFHEEANKGDETSKDYTEYWRTLNRAPSSVTAASSWTAAFTAGESNEIPELVTEDEFELAMAHLKSGKAKATVSARASTATTDDAFERHMARLTIDPMNRTSQAPKRILPSDIAALPDEPTTEGALSDFWRSVKDRITSTSQFVPLSAYQGKVPIPMRALLSDPRVSTLTLNQEMSGTRMQQSTLKLFIDKTARSVSVTTEPHQKDGMIHFPVPSGQRLLRRDFFAVGEHLDPARVTISFKDPITGKSMTVTMRAQAKVDPLVADRAWAGETSSHKHAIVLRFDMNGGIDAPLEDILLVYVGSPVQTLFHSNELSTEEKALGNMLVAMAANHEVFARNSVKEAPNTAPAHTASLAVGAAWLRHHASSGSSEARSNNNSKTKIVRAKAADVATLHAYAKQLDTFAQGMQHHEEMPKMFVAERRGEALHRYIQTHARAAKVSTAALNETMLDVASLYHMHFTRSPSESVNLRFAPLRATAVTEANMTKLLEDYFA